MNTNNIKKYAPKARREFMDAVAKRLNTFGITANKKGELQIAEANLQGSVLQIAGNSFDGKLAEPRKRIVARSKKLGYAQLIEQVAYTWFNRLCAIRYMEIHDYLGHGFRVLSHPDNSQGAGATNKGRFEIIDHAQDAADELGLDRARIIELKLAGNKDEELYRELLLGQCHKLHEAMPFLFDALDDETELLLPDNLTRTDSILRGLVDSIPEEDWQQVEVIGWLYQFYISEKKDQVMGKVVKSEDIPAATQLFTPNWIVKYLVQNSVGRQWLQTYPDSAIKSQMEYYIEPAEQSDEVNQQLKAITPLSSNGEGIEPETIKVLDPACGSGHILIEAYNVLKAIYEERGFRSRDIPKMILENNLYGLDIDDRAAQLSGFALMMMARDDDKRIFTRNVRLNVLSLQESNHIDLPTLWKALNLSGSWQSGTSQGLFADEEQDLSSFNADNRYQLLKRTLARFTQAKTFGSLIDVPSDEHEQLKELMSTLVELQESGDSMQKPAAKQLIEFVHQALVLSTRYDAVIANPPYMGSKYQTAEVKNYLEKEFKGFEKDLFSAFTLSCGRLAIKFGHIGIMSPNVWMYISTHLRLREEIIFNKTLLSLIELPLGGFKGATVQICSFIYRNEHINNFNGKFIRLVGNKGGDLEMAQLVSEAINRKKTELIYHSRPDEFKKINSMPIAYWLTDKTRQIFSENKTIKSFVPGSVGLQTGDNEQFVRRWSEVNFSNLNVACISREDAAKNNSIWVPYNKGGEYRKWYGNHEWCVYWKNDGEKISAMIPKAVIRNPKNYFKESISWSDITSGKTSFRYFPTGFIYDVTGMSAHNDDNDILIKTLAFCNTKIVEWLVESLNPTLHFQVGNYSVIPYADDVIKKVSSDETKRAIELVKDDWDSFEGSWNFLKSPLINDESTIRDSFNFFVELSEKKRRELEKFETKLNEYFISAFGLEDEITPIVPERDITLKSNPYYLFGDNLSETDLKNRFQSTTLSDFISYSVGCTMGRYSLDREGLVYAHSGNDCFDKLVAEGAYQSFAADEDGIIPLTDQEWFKDDATNRFREFVQVVWGEEHLQENLDFVAESLCLNAIKPKKSESALETIRRYLSTQFYKDHLKTYKKRPIYWLFSSGKQKAFECLVYLHRYNEGTLSRMRTEYVTPLLGKYDAYAEQLEKQIETADSTSEANRFKKELDALIKKQVELREFDDKLKHYADMRNRFGSRGNIMNIQKLEIKGFKSIAHVSLENISPFLVFAGANGAGKSNLVDALVFLGAVVQRGAIQAIREFGGFSQIHCFKFRKEQRTTMSFALTIDIDGMLFDYSLKIRALNKAPELQESLKIDQASIIDRKAVGETLISLTEGAPLQKLPDYPKEMSALMLLGKNPLYGFLTNIRVFRIDPFAAKEPDTSTADASILDAQGKNIATMLSVLEKDEDFREQIIEWIELIVPGMEAVATEKQRLDSSTVITFKEEGTRARFPAKLISDGTIYALCILTAILSRSKSSGITIIEEPERGIHPKAIAELVSLMRDNASTEHPVFITTHSESVVRNLETKELYFASKVDGKTQLQGALDSGVDKTKIPLDTAWLTNLFDGGLPW